MRIMHSFTLHPQAGALDIPLVIIDMKADPELATYAHALAQRTRRTFHHVSVKDGSYNPVAMLDGDELADSIYETFFANDPTLNTHYATLSRRLLQVAAGTLLDLAENGIHKVGAQRAWQRSLSDLTDLLSLNTLRSVQTDLTPHVAARLHTYLGDIDAEDNAKDVGDVRDRLAVIMHTSVGDVLSVDGFTLEAAIRSGDIIVFSLDAAGTPETAPSFSTSFPHLAPPKSQTSMPAHAAQAEQSFSPPKTLTQTLNRSAPSSLQACAQIPTSGSSYDKHVLT